MAHETTNLAVGPPPLIRNGTRKAVFLHCRHYGLFAISSVRSSKVESLMQVRCDSILLWKGWRKLGGPVGTKPVGCWSDNKKLVYELRKVCPTNISVLCWKEVHAKGGR
jgi:hypothetical protein